MILTLLALLEKAKPGFNALETSIHVLLEFSDHRYGIAIPIYHRIQLSRQKLNLFHSLCLPSRVGEHPCQVLPHTLPAPVARK
jgi:hypothetical protein